MTRDFDPTGPRTLAVDCGGTGIKACVLSPTGEMLGDRARVLTPYPCPPDVLVSTVAKLAVPLGPYDRVSVGFPGLVRHGVVRATPHYVSESGPFTPARSDLIEAWAGYDIAAALAEALGRPTRVLNDAEVQGYAAVAGAGYEVVLTLGTGLGFAHFDDGRLLPKLELSAHPYRKGGTYDERLGNHVRREIGNARWSRRVTRAVATLRPVLGWDHLYVGGGNARHLDAAAVASFGPRTTLVPNSAGLLGGVHLWTRTGG